MAVEHRGVDIVRPLYNGLRPYLPRRVGYRNGIKTRCWRLFDLERSDPDWKQPLIDAIRDLTDPGDHTVHVGGGWGTTIALSAQFGPVTCFEASDRFARITRETAALNGVGDRVEVRHSVVETPGDVWDGQPANAISAADLPDCDVLVLDCEGAETAILQNLESPPRKLIVECGGAPHRPVSEVKASVESLGYDAIQTQPQNDQTVLRGVMRPMVDLEAHQ